MDNSKCDCGAVKTYGLNATTHSDWCSALKRDPDPEPNGAPEWPWDSSGWIMQDGVQDALFGINPSSYSLWKGVDYDRASCELTVDKIKKAMDMMYRSFDDEYEQAMQDIAIYGEGCVCVDENGNVKRVNPFDIEEDE